MGLVPVLFSFRCLVLCAPVALWVAGIDGSCLMFDLFAFGVGLVGLVVRGCFVSALCCAVICLPFVSCCLYVCVRFLGFG